MLEVICWLDTLGTLTSITLFNVPQFPEEFKPLGNLKRLHRLGLTSVTTLTGLLGASELPESIGTIGQELREHTSSSPGGMKFRRLAPNLVALLTIARKVSRGISTITLHRDL